MKIKIKEAIGFAVSRGNMLTSVELSAKLWPESKPEARRTMYYNLMHGKTKRIEVDLIPKICQHTGVTPNFLFGWEEPA